MHQYLYMIYKMSILKNFIYQQFLSKTITYFMYVVYVNIHFEFKYVCTWGYNDYNANPYFIFWVYALLYYSRNKNHAKFNSTCTCLSDGKFSIHNQVFMICCFQVFSISGQFKITCHCKRCISVNFQIFSNETDGFSMLHWSKWMIY